MTISAAYIRESEADQNTDKEGQLLDCRTIAAREGIDPTSLVVYDDWNRSGSETATRPAQDKLIADVKAGNVSLIVARSIDRLMRSTVRMAAFYTLCEAHGTRIVTLREGEMRSDNPSQWIARQSIMMAAEYESRVAKVRARATVATKRRNGTPIGRAPYGTQPGESVAAVLAAFSEADGFLPACKLLNERGLATRLGGPWNVRTLSRIVRRERPDLLPARPRAGARARATRIFSGLLLCHCGDTLTTMPRAGNVGYYCRRAHHVAGHPRPYVVSEAKLLPWCKAEADRLRLPFDTVAMESTDHERAALAAKRTRIIDLAIEGTIDKADRDARLSAVDAALSVLDARAQVVAVPAIDWTGSPAALNVVLRALWRSVRLGPDLLPVSADWTDPTWRSRS